MSCSGDAEICLLGDQLYTPGPDGSGADCPPEQTENECIGGDLCTPEGLCEPVLSGATAEISCELVAARYSPGADGSGPDCPPEQIDDECIEGDRCTVEGLCQPALSAAFGPLHTNLLDLSYTPAPDASGADCPPSQIDNECIEGDLCSNDLCVVVLSARGGIVDAGLIGTEYTPLPDGSGPDCPPEQIENECIEGDLCLANGMCEVVLSAKL